MSAVAGGTEQARTHFERRLTTVTTRAGLISLTRDHPENPA
jgi:hypothetical protein